MQREPLNVVAIAYQGLHLFELGIVVELFGLPRPELETWYRFRVARAHDGPLRAIGGISIDAPYTLNILDSASTIIVPGWQSLDTPVPEKLIHKLRKAHAEGARIASVCSGAFVLAAAGLLDGKRATTHWRYAEALANRFPNVTIDADVLYVDDGNVVTSAGSAAGVDMGLHLIRKDFGVKIANQVARRLVLPPHREGGQKQFIDMPVACDASEDAFAELLDTLREELSSPHTVDSMARRANMSKRTFARRFQAVTGTTPHRWLQSERARLAMELLETTSLPLERIAENAGFSDPQLLRLHFKRVVGTAPSEYRRTFRQQN